MEYKIVLPGLGASSNRGALGWASISLISHNGKNLLFDTGSCDDRENLIDGLKSLETSPDEIDMVFISHFHYDHCNNIELFKNAEIMVSKREFDYVINGEFLKASDPYVPEAVVRYFSEKFRLVENDEEIIKGVKALSLPGHTPGITGLLLEEEGVIFTGDAVKNAWDFTHNHPPLSFFSKKEGLESYNKIKNAAKIIVPGHGRPFKLESTHIHYVGKYTPIEIETYPNHEHLEELKERPYTKIIV